MGKSFREDLKRATFTGLAALLPTLITIFIFVWVIQFLDKYIASYLREGIRFVLIRWFGYSGGGTAFRVSVRNHHAARS